MKISAIRTFSVKNQINFKQHEDDEYVYVPLVWNDEVDTYQSSKKPSVEPVSNGNSDSKFKKVKKGLAWIGGGIVAAPTVVESTAKTVEKTITSTEVSFNNSVDSLARMRDKTQQLFHKNKQEQAAQVSHDNAHEESGDNDYSEHIANSGDEHHFSDVNSDEHDSYDEYSEDQDFDPNTDIDPDDINEDF